MPQQATSGAVLTAPQKGILTKAPAYDSKPVISAEQPVRRESGIQFSLTMFDTIIGVSVLVIIGFIVHMVATTKAPKK